MEGSGASGWPHVNCFHLIDHSILHPLSSILHPPSSILYPHVSLWFWWLGALLCVAGGILTKWTAPAFFYGTVVTLLWWRGRLRLLLGRHHLVGAAVCASLCLAWIGTAVALSNWHAFSVRV